MLDYFAIFTKGGALLWTIQLTALRGTPVDYLIRTCLLEERSGESSFTYSPPQGAGYTMKWTLHNALDLVFVAVYQKALKLLYVEELLERVKSEFAAIYKPREYNYGRFETSFKAALAQCEAEADAAKRAPPQVPAKAYVSKKGIDRKQANGQRQANGKASDAGEGDGDDSSDAANKTTSGMESPDALGESTDNGGSEGDSAFNQDAMAKKKLQSKRGPGGKPPSRKALDKPAPKKKVAEPKKKEARKWGDSSDGEVAVLDYSAGPGENGGAENGTHIAPVAMNDKSLLDVDEEIDDDYGDEDDEAENEGVAANGKPKKAGLLSSFVRNISVSVVGTAALTRGDIQAGLEGLKRKLMERNVAEEIAEKLCESVATGLEGKKLGSFTRIGSVVRNAVEEALTRILTPKRSIDVLREVRAAQAKRKPYVIVFVGVNGVGKSTNLAKVTYWLLQNGIKPMVAACDTFRSGAVEQLRTHCTRLQVPLYERGYEKDPAKVAFEAIKAAERNGCDVVMVDTAGRMQDNEPLMRALANLINLNNPDLVLFVGEALVGNDAVDQLTKFNQRLTDLADRSKQSAVDGVLLTKFDVVDEKVGAAISMVYTSGAPIMFVGCGQTYVDLKRLNVKSVVKALLQ
ncbi:hypothetical protein WJX72_002707 [[Myrmecia] bisecta]|uniref:SRP54-type proteins GTP-binding domain-containing protein n=1 Tax=[Myrmecia] bisecta TaxID=41462 RepID=A0AAW1Q4Q8_9CHLO